MNIMVCVPGRGTEQGAEQVQISSQRSSMKHLFVALHIQSFKIEADSYELGLLVQRLLGSSSQA